MDLNLDVIAGRQLNLAAHIQRDKGGGVRHALVKSEGSRVVDRQEAEAAASRVRVPLSYGEDAVDTCTVGDQSVVVLKQVAVVGEGGVEGEEGVGGRDDGLRSAVVDAGRGEAGDGRNVDERALNIQRPDYVDGVRKEVLVARGDRVVVARGNRVGDRVGDTVSGGSPRQGPLLSQPLEVSLRSGVCRYVGQRERYGGLLWEQ